MRNVTTTATLITTRVSPHLAELTDHNRSVPERPIAVIHSGRVIRRHGHVSSSLLAPIWRWSTFTVEHSVPQHVHSRGCETLILPPGVCDGDSNTVRGEQTIAMWAGLRDSSGIPGTKVESTVITLERMEDPCTSI